MAFFLVMWLINATDKQTLTQVATYFNPMRLTDKVPLARGLHQPEVGLRPHQRVRDRRPQATSRTGQGRQQGRDEGRGQQAHAKRGDAVPRSLCGAFQACCQGRSRATPRRSCRAAQRRGLSRSLRAGLPPRDGGRQTAGGQPRGRQPASRQTTSRQPAGREGRSRQAAGGQAPGRSISNRRNRSRPWPPSPALLPQRRRPPTGHRRKARRRRARQRRRRSSKPLRRRSRRRSRRPWRAPWPVRCRAST